MTRLNFKQREGLEELPRALRSEEFPEKLRVAIWNLLYSEMSPCEVEDMYAEDGFRVKLKYPWDSILKVKYEHFGRRIDQYNLTDACDNMENLYNNEKAIDIYDDLDFIISLDYAELDEFRGKLKLILDYSQCAYTIFFKGKDSVIALRNTEEEKITIENCYEDLKKKNFNGAKQHLINSAKYLNDNKFSDSVRESISAVESVCRIIAKKPKAVLTDALKEIQRKMYINGRLEAGFEKLYNYSSGEDGIRHSLFEDDKSKVDLIDAQYMLGSCASFISYLINKANNFVLLEENTI